MHADVAHASRIMKLVAQTSSSRMRQLAPSSRASWMLAAWLVLPLASGELKLVVSLPARRYLLSANLSQVSAPSTCFSRRVASCSNCQCNACPANVSSGGGLLGQQVLCYLHGSSEHGIENR